MTEARTLGRTAPTRAWPPTILDRYLVSELGGPFLFGLSAFTLIFVATQILAIGRLVSEEHAPLWAAVEYFLWDMPYYLLLVIPMAMLLGTLLAMQRLSSESEITAMKAGGISLSRIVAPLLIVGIVVSVVSLAIQELFVPFANDKAAYVRQQAIEHVSPASSNLQAVTPLPGGGKQITIAGGLDVATQTLLGVTVIRYDAAQKPVDFVVADRARYVAPTWTFENSTTYHFNPDGSTVTQTAPTLVVDIGERPNQIAKQSINITNPEDLSRAEIRERLQSGQLSPQQQLTFTATYASKLARPFAAFVFTLIAVPFGLRPVRGGGTGLGFGLAVAIVFVYYVISTIFLTVGSMAAGLAGPAAWAPNVIFTVIGAWLLRRASRV
ncbi:MAG: LptF/LptG family permease [Candidatus Eremiobacteraeota bacterium]|nr:LptF/LptG family permease [Candidatus Eremiobacteraeota bacterium]